MTILVEFYYVPSERKINFALGLECKWELYHVKEGLSE